MTRVEVSVDILAPLAEVFTYASDWRRWEEWWTSVSNFKPTTGVTRGNGARYSYKTRIAGVRTSIETEIHDFAENVGWTGIVVKGPPHKTKWVFEGHGSQTQFTYILEYSLPVPVLGPLMDVLLVRPGWRRRLEKSLENLRVYFERRAGI
jgi:hypothetical protein